MPTTEHSIDLSAGRVRYTDSGSGPPIVFIHGVFVNGLLWRKVVPLLEGSARCIVPTLPLGAHLDALTDPAARSPRGVAALIAEFLAALDLHDVTLVGNDSGGALCQLVVTRQPERIARIVLTNCDSFENFPPPLLRPLYAAARIPGFIRAFAQVLRVPQFRRAFLWTVATSAGDPDVLAAWFVPIRENASVRRDLTAFVAAASAPELVAAGNALRDFPGRALIVWGTADLFFPLRDGRRLAAAFRDANLVEVAGARTFVPEDAPMLLAASIDRFVSATAAA